MKQGLVRDFLAFRKMLTPIIVVGLFWLGAALCIIGGIVAVVMGLVSDYGGGRTVLIGLAGILLGPILVRLWCEMMILFFRINETLTEIKGVLEKQEPQPERQLM